MNCLNCRQCKLEPDTDFTKRGTQIYCGAPSREGEIGRKPLNLSGCPSAERIPNNGYSEVWWAFFKALIPSCTTTAKRHKLAAIMGKEWKSILKRANLKGIKIPKTTEQLTAMSAMMHSGYSAILTPEQFKYLTDAYETGFWPIKFGILSPEETRINNARVKRTLIREVANRGQAKSWNALRNWAGRQSPSYLRRKGKT